ncbi:MAG TPA: LamG domain-containing protein [Puia sp.]|nr:LamG domain-containing protein [Puia sp.]
MQHLKIKRKPALTFVLVFSLFILSCQKKFDPKSYAPAQTFGGYSASNQIAPSDLVAHFSFENGLTDSVSKTSATATGTTYSTGIKGQAMQIGLNNYALFTPTTAIKNLQSMTLTYWVNTSINTAGIQEPICFANSTQFWSNLDMFFDGQTTTTSVFKIHAFGNSGNSEAWLTSWSLASPWNTWIHIALTYDATTGTFSFYANGAPIGSSVQAAFGALNFANVPSIVFGTIQFQTTPSLTSGATSQSWASYLLGVLDEVRIYDKALGASDIKALYQLENLGK